MITDIITSFIVAVLQGMGIGGGGLLVLYLVLIKDMPQLESQSLNLLFFIASALFSLPIHIKKRKLEVGKIIFISAIGLIGVYAGYLCAKAISPQYVRKAFALMLIASSFITFFKKSK